MSAFIEVKDLVCERFRRDEDGNVTSINRVLDGVTLELHQGEFIGILGRNGSGKSTLARHLNALLLPTEGSVVVSGKNSAKEENVLEIRKLVGMVFQNPDNQMVASVVEEDVGFGPENQAMPTKEIWKRVDESLQAVRMQEYRKHSPNRLSGGQKQRVAIAGVLAMRPKCIIMDEATAMLDPVGRREILEVLQRLNQEENITVLWITHYMEEVLHADRIFVTEQGKIVMQGKPEEIFARQEELEAYQLTLPEVTRFAATLHRRGIPVPENVLTVEQLIDCLADLM